MGIVGKIVENDAILLLGATLSDQYFPSYSQNKFWPLTFSYKKSIGLHIQFFAYKSKTIKATVSCKSLVNGFLECSF